MATPFPSRREETSHCRPFSDRSQRIDDTLQELEWETCFQPPQPTVKKKKREAVTRHAREGMKRQTSTGAGHRRVLSEAP